jgi:hypothetical protein
LERLTHRIDISDSHDINTLKGNQVKLMQQTDSPVREHTLANEKRVYTFAGLLFIPFIALLAFLSIQALNPPQAVSENASPTEFSSERAMTHLRQIASRPRPIGSPEQADARTYIFNELAKLDLEPEIQEATVLNQNSRRYFSAATVHNIIGRLRGASSVKSVLLVAHYDSVPTSAGASDDGAGVVTILESVRALKSSAPLQNDVIVLFTDGEETGLFGARAFVGEHALAKDVGVLLNFEARGNSGPALMFETSPNNAWLIERFAEATPHPVANSLFYEAYKYLPNDTDMSVFKRAGFAGLNFAYIEGVNHYHSRLDNVQNLDESSLQHKGSYAIALARDFGNFDFQPKTKGDAVYFNLFGLKLIHYSANWALPLALLATLVVALTVVIGFRNKRLTWSGIAKGFAVFSMALIVTPIIIELAWRAIVFTNQAYNLFPQGDTYNSELYIISFISLTIALVSATYIWARKKIDRYNLTVGALLWWLILAILTSIYLPGISYLFAWPLFFTAVGMGLLFYFDKGERISAKRIAILLAYALPAIVLVSPVVYFLYTGLSLSSSYMVVLPIVLLFGLLIPHLEVIATPARWALPVLSALVFVVIVTVGGGFRFDEQNPKPNNIFYGLDSDTKEAFWASADRNIDEWTSQFFTSGFERGALDDFLPLYPLNFLKGEADVADLAPPKLEVLSDNTNDGFRTLKMKLLTQRQAPIISLYTDAAVVEIQVNGKRNDQVDRSSQPVPNGLAFQYYGLPKYGIELSLKVKASDSMKVRLVDQSYGLPAIPASEIKGRPGYMMPTIAPYSDTSLVGRSYTF